MEVQYDVVLMETSDPEKFKEIGLVVDEELHPQNVPLVYNNKK